jgi:hypothetical protein
MYLYVGWVRADREDPRSAQQQFKAAGVCFGIAAALLFLLVLPWALGMSLSLSKVLAADPSIGRLESTMWCVHAFSVAGVLWLIHGSIAAALASNRGSIDV